jgi:hypothetical protein
MPMENQGDGSSMLLNNGEIALYLACAHRTDPRSFVGEHPRSLRGHVISWERGRCTSGKIADHPARIPDCQHIRGEVPDNNTPGAHDSAVADAHAGADHTRSSEPDVVSNDHGFCSLESTASRVHRADAAPCKCELQARSERRRRSEWNCSRGRRNRN